MKLLTFEINGHARLGIKLQEGVLDMEAALQQLPEEGVPATMREVVAGGRQSLERLESYVLRLKETDTGLERALRSEEELTYGPCVTEPGKIICVGLNYRKHAVETGAAIPEYPILFSKFNNALAGHLGTVTLPGRVTEQVDYEAELAIVIGRTAKQVSEEHALDYVLGYCNANDLSARDLQMRTSQWLLGKSADGFCPLGPYLATADEVAAPDALAIRCLVNGEERQSSHTSDMIFNCRQIISYISQHMTLQPGDVILTGTPEGVMLGYPPDRRVYLREGDEVTVEIEGLGSLTNYFVQDKR